ncbi:hypothetical protein C8R44DRAFT_736110 [Mycena epipterygia]|nr:hypothetical protein C8R44DRAFT_736110 [Mycena epipterygia]
MASRLEAKPGASLLPGRTVSDSGGGSSWKSKSRKETTSVDNSEQEQILIMLLIREKKEKDSKGEMKGMPNDDATWRCLARRPSTRSARKPSPPTSALHSPWMGPLVHLGEEITYIRMPEHTNYAPPSSRTRTTAPPWARGWARARAGPAVAPSCLSRTFSPRWATSHPRPLPWVARSRPAGPTLRSTFRTTSRRPTTFTVTAAAQLRVVVL